MVARLSPSASRSGSNGSICTSTPGRPRRVCRPVGTNICADACAATPRHVVAAITMVEVYLAAMRLQRAKSGLYSWSYRKGTAMRVLLLSATAAGVLVFPGLSRAQDACANVPALAKSLPDTTIQSSKPVPANAQDRLPAFCEVHATIAPVPGSRIGAVYRLPANWNGKVLGIGGGGFAGNVTLAGAANGLARGYAVIQNDMGHESTASLDPTFAIARSGQPNVEAIVDFGHRATHVA